MDSITQALLGAATFALVKEKDLGRKSLLIGAAAGTIPDLDVLLAPFYNEVAFLSIHRSASHSLLLALVLSVFLGEVFHRIYRKEQQRLTWMFAFFLSISTHALLDWFTTYGTQLFSPFDGHLFSLNSIHVFEPVYTSILLIGILIYSFKRKVKRSMRPVKVSLYLSSFYLVLALISKNHAYYHFKAQLEAEGKEYQEILVSPTPLNIFLWHGIIKQEEGYLFGLYSIFDGTAPVQMQFVESNHAMLENFEGHEIIKKYVQYTKGFPLVQTEANGDVRIYAVKFGPINYFGEPEFVYPLKFNLHCMDEGNFSIERDGKQSGPVKNYKNLIARTFAQP